MNAFCICKAESISGSFAPFLEGVCKRTQRHGCRAIFLPEAFYKVHPLDLTGYGSDFRAKETVCPRECLVKQRDQSVSQCNSGIHRALIMAALDFQHLAGFILRRVFLQLRSIGQCVVSDLHGVGLIRFHFSDRVIAKVMDQHCIDNINEETDPLQLQHNGPPVHTSMLHDDADFTTNRVQSGSELLQIFRRMADVKRCQYDLAAGSANSNGTLAF